MAAVSLTRLRKALAEGPGAVRRLAWPEPEATQPALTQLALWVRDADGLPERPWRVGPESVVLCAALKCTVPARVCVVRQLASEVQRTQDRHRGEASDYPRCVTERCAQGRGIREALDPCAQVAWRGTGLGGRVRRERPRGERAAQDAARERQARVGLLEQVRMLDVDPDPLTEDA
jgi:hypothetical protein